MSFFAFKSAISNQQSEGGGVKIPYIQKEVKLMRALKREHGARKAKQIYHAMLNSKEHEENFGAWSKRERGKSKKTAHAQKRKKPRERKTRRQTRRSK